MDSDRLYQAKSRFATARFVVACALTGWVFIQSLAPAHAQSVHLIDPTATNWRYLANGVDQGTAWTQFGFNDSGWPSGRGLFGSESTVYPFPFNTFIPSPSAGGPITAYYRAHFFWSGDPSNVALNLLAFIDDSCVFYLNGVEFARFNISANPVQFYSFADMANPGGEPVIAAGSLAAPSLRTGDNVLAVEVHQWSPETSDHVFGLDVS